MVVELKRQEIIVNNLAELYEVDDYLWLEKTIKILSTKQLNNLDIDHLIEELESLAKRDLNKVRSLLRQIIIHLLLLEYWTEEYDRNYRHWRCEVIAFREDLNNSLTTTLKNKLSAELNHIYEVAVKFVINKANLLDNRIPTKCPYSIPQILDDNWLP